MKKEIINIIVICFFVFSNNVFSIEPGKCSKNPLSLSDCNPKYSILNEIIEPGTQNPVYYIEIPYFSKPKFVGGDNPHYVRCELLDRIYYDPKKIADDPNYNYKAVFYYNPGGNQIRSRGVITDDKEKISPEVLRQASYSLILDHPSSSKGDEENFFTGVIAPSASKTFPKFIADGVYVGEHGELPLKTLNMVSEEFTLTSKVCGESGCIDKTVDAISNWLEYWKYLDDLVPMYDTTVGNKSYYNEAHGISDGYAIHALTYTLIGGESMDQYCAPNANYIDDALESYFTGADAAMAAHNRLFTKEFEKASIEGHSAGANGILALITTESLMLKDPADPESGYNEQGFEMFVNEVTSYSSAFDYTHYLLESNYDNYNPPGNSYSYAYTDARGDTYVISNIPYLHLGDGQQRLHSLKGIMEETTGVENISYYIDFYTDNGRLPTVGECNKLSDPLSCHSVREVFLRHSLMDIIETRQSGEDYWVDALPPVHLVNGMTDAAALPHFGIELCDAIADAPTTKPDRSQSSNVKVTVVDDQEDAMDRLEFECGQKSTLTLYTCRGHDAIANTGGCASVTKNGSPMF